MNKILNLAKDFQIKSNEQAEAIESALANDFERHKENIRAALNESEKSIRDAISAHNTRTRSIALKTWLWLGGSILIALMASGAAIAVQSQIIANNYQEIREQNATLKQLADKGGKIQMSNCGGRLCIPAAKDNGNWTRSKDNRPMFIPEGY
ncbi:MbeB family mobilization protein [Zooshikella sp. RANM57]|uniref:MbeB family mobilization protein n=1 Tax=Zooshikella sp. RANM57 TaxID=3425863 RepID=UPI003D6F23C1